MVGSAAGRHERPFLNQGTLCFVAESILWTVIYDKIYANREIQADVRLGVKSMAMLFTIETHIESMLWFVWWLMGAALILYATLEEIGFQFYLITVFGSLHSLGAMISKVELGNKVSCW